MLGLDCGSGVFGVNVRDQNVADVVPELTRTQLEITIAFDGNFSPLVDGPPAVSQLKSLVGVVDDRVGKVGVDSESSYPLGGDSLNNLS